MQEGFSSSWVPTSLPDGKRASDRISPGRCVVPWVSSSCPTPVPLSHLAQATCRHPSFPQKEPSTRTRPSDPTIRARGWPAPPCCHPSCASVIVLPKCRAWLQPQLPGNPHVVSRLMKKRSKESRDHSHSWHKPQGCIHRHRDFLIKNGKSLETFGKSGSAPSHKPDPLQLRWRCQQKIKMKSE